MISIRLLPQCTPQTNMKPSEGHGPLYMPSFWLPCLGDVGLLNQDIAALSMLTRTSSSQGPISPVSPPSPVLCCWGSMGSLAALQALKQTIRGSPNSMGGSTLQFQAGVQARGCPVTWQVARFIRPMPSCGILAGIYVCHAPSVNAF